MFEVDKEFNVNPDLSGMARRLGFCSAVATVALIAAYAMALAVGFSSIASPQQPIGDPVFSILEILIILLMPVMVTLMASIHIRAPAKSKVLSLAALVFMSLLAGLTCSVHFVILTLSHHPVFSDQSWLPLFLSFKWPSVVYALDILGWDVFFPLAMFFAAPTFGGSRLARWIRFTMIVSGVLALAGLSGVVMNDMRFRNIGIVGYVVGFFVVALLLAVFFARANRDLGEDSNSRTSP